MPDQRVELHGREAEGAVTREQHHLAVGVGELRRQRVAGPGAEAAVGAGVQPEARARTLDQAPREGDEVAAVPDQDGVRVAEALHLRHQPGRMDG